MRALRYSIAQAASVLARRPRRAAASVATIAAASFVLAAFLLVAAHIDRMVTSWGGLAEIAVYFDDAATEAQQAAVERVLDESPLVAGRERVSKSGAAERFAREFPDLAGAVEAGAANPFPASIEVRLHVGRADPAGLDRLTSALAQSPGVVDVRDDRRWLERLLRLAGVVRSVGLALAVALIASSVLTIASVVRLGLYERRDEIEIMELVGAPLSFIRGPFVAEGIIQGGLGALVALTLAWAGHTCVAARYAPLVSDFIDPRLMHFLSWGTCALLIAGGMAVGCLGGFAASRLRGAAAPVGLVPSGR